MRLTPNYLVPHKLLTGYLFVDTLFDLQFVLYVKSTRRLARCHVGKLAIALIRYDPFQGDMAVVHDDVDRRTRPRGIPEQWCFEVINPSVELGPKLVIHWRKRQHLDVVA